MKILRTWKQLTIYNLVFETSKYHAYYYTSNIQGWAIKDMHDA